MSRQLFTRGNHVMITFILCIMKLMIKTTYNLTKETIIAILRDYQATGLNEINQ